MDKTLSFIGLARKAGFLKLGEENTGAAARSRKARAILLASDASDNARRRAKGFVMSGGGIPLLELPYTKAELYTALGGIGCAMAAVTDIGFASNIAMRLCETDPAKFEEQSTLLQKKSQKAARRKRETVLRDREKNPGKRRS